MLCYVSLPNLQKFLTEIYSELDYYGDALNFAQGHVSTLHISQHDVHAACVFFTLIVRVLRIISLHFIQWHYVQGSLCLPDPPYCVLCVGRS